jgi:hypothetical protein
MLAKGAIGAARNGVSECSHLAKNDSPARTLPYRAAPVLSALDGASNVTKPFAILQFAERELLL